MSSGTTAVDLQVYYEPKITVLSTPSFTNPADLPTTYYGHATPVEQLSEYAGRVCYMSQSNPGRKTTEQYLTHILDMGHGSVLEHGMFSYLIEGVSRALTHELIRHRVGTAISQLSQRFVDESDTAFVCPPEIAKDDFAHGMWLEACASALKDYKRISDELDECVDVGLKGTLRRKRIREAARAVLPNCTETKLVWSCNLRQLRHILVLRGSVHADLEFQQLARRLLSITRPLAPSALGDLDYDPALGIVQTQYTLTE